MQVRGVVMFEGLVNLQHPLVTAICRVQLFEGQLTTCPASVRHYINIGVTEYINYVRIWASQSHHLCIYIVMCQAHPALVKKSD